LLLSWLLITNDILTPEELIAVQYWIFYF